MRKPWLFFFFLRGGGPDLNYQVQNADSPLGTASQSIAVPDCPQYCLALLMSLAVGTQVASWLVPELFSCFPHIYHFVIPDSESQ